ncbi:sensor histidine kinase [Duganella radicis]|uniref:sensor histidine kinase n=1 Tax=Duganella radicis TaxID=551988 RepID=UPI0014794299|nr:histidine kinase [Duganella radicis]
MSSYSQTPIFLLLGLLLACLSFVAAFVICLRRLRRGYEARMRQLAERERVATGLHDTLLQSMQGLILRFHGVSHRLAADSAERATIEHILDQADEVLAEGRHQILALRMPVVYGDNLSQALAAIGQSLQDNFNTPFRMVVGGRPTAISGDRGEEIYSIAREALYNAFQHAQADSVELELVYGCEFFLLYVRDDGKGMEQPPDGLAGMRARAARLAATVEVLSLPEQGTEVILKVPGQICYQTPRHGGWQCRLAAWLGRTEHHG